jgi:hypothetical protein
MTVEPSAAAMSKRVPSNAMMLMFAMFACPDFAL